MKALAAVLGALSFIVLLTPGVAQTRDEERARYVVWLDQRYRDLLRDLDRVKARVRDAAPLSQVAIIDSIQIEVDREQQKFEISSSVREGRRMITVSHFAFDVFDGEVGCLALELAYRFNAEGSTFLDGVDLSQLLAFQAIKRAALQEKENKVRRSAPALPADHYLRRLGSIGLGNHQPCTLPNAYHAWLNSLSFDEARVYRILSGTFREAFLLFVIGHEVGHHVMGHFEERRRDAVQMEVEADAYAVSVIFRVMGPEAAFASIVPVAAIHYFYGFLDIGLPGPKRSSVMTTHPSADCRILDYLANFPSWLRNIRTNEEVWRRIRAIAQGANIKELRERFDC